MEYINFLCNLFESNVILKLIQIIQLDFPNEAEKESSTPCSISYFPPNLIEGHYLDVFSLNVDFALCLS